jgi:hypothetical protein
MSQNKATTDQRLMIGNQSAEKRKEKQSDQSQSSMSHRISANIEACSN